VVHSPAVVYAPAPYPVYGVAAPVYAPPPVYSTYPAYGYAHRPPVVVVRRAPVIVYEHGYRHRGHGHRHFHDGGHPGRRY
jgi:hypothetical protein